MLKEQIITLLPNPDFLSWLIGAIESAKRSIIIVNYLATLKQNSFPSPLVGEGQGEGGHDPVTRIVIALIASAKRGVAVTVILEGSKFRENYAFYRALKDGSADVWMDTSLTFIHTKAVLIDDKTLCVGSHNLSANALTRHEEMSMATDDKNAIARFNLELEKMTAQRRAIAEDICREGAKLQMGILIEIKRAIAPRAYFLYLLLCKLDGGKKKEIEVDPKAWASEIALPESTASANVRIASMLDFLDKKLRLVKFNRRKNTVARALNFPSPLVGEGQGEGERALMILLPTSFWQYLWPARLSADALHLYLAGETEKIESPFAPWWRLKRDEIAKKYGFQKQLVGRAQTELKRFGLMEVLFETAQGIQGGRYVRYMNYFRQNPFYDYDARMAEIETLAEKFSQPVLKQARKLASIVCDDSDLDKITSLCALITKSGIKAAESAARKIFSLAANSTKRKFEYVEELLTSCLGR